MKHSSLLFLLLVVLRVNAECLHHGLECDDQARAVCISKGYSTFDLPLRTKPNLIKIGIIQDHFYPRLFLVKFCFISFFQVLKSLMYLESMIRTTPSHLVCTSVLNGWSLV